MVNLLLPFECKKKLFPMTF